MERAHLEKADRYDRDMIFEWANEPEARRNSLHTEKIEYEAHLDWFDKKLKDKDCDFYIYYSGDIPVGQIRIDYKEGIGLISFSIDHRFRGQGHGGILLKLAEDKVIESRPEIDALEGIVKKENIASQKKFEELNYNKAEASEDKIIKYHKIIK